MALNFRSTTARLALIVALGPLSACAGFDGTTRDYDKVKSTLVAADASAAAANHRQDPPPIERSSMPYLGSAQVDDAHGDPLPSSVQGTLGFHATHGSYSVESLATDITLATGLPVIVDTNSQRRDQPVTSAKAQRPAATGADPSVADIDNILASADGHLTASTDARRVSSLRPHIAVDRDYDGPLNAFLTSRLPQADEDWEYRSGTIYITKVFTRSYRVSDFSTDTSSSSDLSGGSLSTGTSGTGATNSTTAGTASPSGTPGSTGGDGGPTTSNATKINSWKDLEAALKEIARDGTVVLDRADQKILVTCSRRCQAEARSYIADHNRDATREVDITIAVVGIGNTGTDSYGFDPTLIYQNLPTGYGISLLGQTALPTAAGAGSITGAILNPPAGSTAAKYTGTNLAIQALTQTGSNSVEYYRHVITANNRVAGKQDGTVVPYEQNSGTTISSAAAVSSNTVQFLPIGNNVTVLPHLTDDGLIRLQITVTRSNQTGNVTFDNGGGSTNTVPVTANDNTSSLEFSIRDGATLLLADASDSTGTQGNSGAGSIYNWLLGGSATSTTNKTRTVLIVSAHEWRPDTGDSLRAPGPAL